MWSTPIYQHRDRKFSPVLKVSYFLFLISGGFLISLLCQWNEHVFFVKLIEKKDKPRHAFFERMKCTLQQYIPAFNFNFDTLYRRCIAGCILE